MPSSPAGAGLQGKPPGWSRRGAPSPHPSLCTSCSGCTMAVCCTAHPSLRQVAVFAAASETYSRLSIAVAAAAVWEASAVCCVLCARGGRHSINCSIEDAFDRFQPVVERAARCSDICSRVSRCVCVHSAGRLGGAGALLWQGWGAGEGLCCGRDGVRVRGYVSCVMGCPYEGQAPPTLPAPSPCSVPRAGAARGGRRARSTATCAGVLPDFAGGHHRCGHPR